VDARNIVCLAENVAGMSSDNLTLLISDSQYNIVNPSIEKSRREYVAIIAIGALFGTLLALGCLFLGIFLFARNLNSYSKKNPKKLSSTSTMVSASMLKKNLSNSLSKMHILNDFTCTINNDCRGNAKFMPSEHFMIHTNTEKYNDKKEIACHQIHGIKYMPQNSLIDPDIINEVGTEKNYLAFIYTQSDQINSEPVSSYLDQDGYPLNFGLPKLDCNITHIPKIHPEMHYVRETDFIKHASTYTTNPVMKIDNMPMTTKSLKHFRITDSYNNIETLSPITLFNPKAQSNDRTTEDLAIINSLNIAVPLFKIPESIKLLTHPDSSDEGYVGDVMDI
jgi:uncharacterized protein YneF (UPF0154 family)